MIDLTSLIAVIDRFGHAPSSITLLMLLLVLTYRVFRVAMARVPPESIMAPLFAWLGFGMLLGLTAVLLL